MSFPNNALEAIAWESVKRSMRENESVTSVYDRYIDALERVTKHAKDNQHGGFTKWK